MPAGGRLSTATPRSGLPRIRRYPARKRIDSQQSTARLHIEAFRQIFAVLCAHANLMEQDCGKRRSRYVGGMSKLIWLPIAAAACCGITAGCTRTSDGSVVLARPMSLPRALGGTPAPSYAPPSFQQLPAPAGPAPVASGPSFVSPASRPAPARAAQSGVKIWKPAVVKAPFGRADPSRPVACRNETSAGGRIRVVCQ